jgi:hypothetical protein
LLTPAGTSSDPYIFNSEGAKVDVISIGTAMDHGLVAIQQQELNLMVLLILFMSLEKLWHL